MDFKVVEVKENLLIENDEKALALHKKLNEKGIYFINVMASPGSGKTTLLIRLINELKKDYCIGVMEADIDGDVDAEKIDATLEHGILEIKLPKMEKDKDTVKKIIVK